MLIFISDWREEYQGTLIQLAKRRVSAMLPVIHLVSPRPGKLNLWAGEDPPYPSRVRITYEIQSKT